MNRQPIATGAIVLIVEEGLRPPVAALGHRMRNTREYRSRHPDYDRTLRRLLIGVNGVHCHRNHRNLFEVARGTAAARRWPTKSGSWPNRQLWAICDIGLLLPNVCIGCRLVAPEATFEYLASGMTFIDAIPSIETDRLRLRGPKPEDFPVYRDFFADADASAFYGGPMEADRAWRVLATDLGHWALRGYGRWSVIEKQSGVMIGGCGLWWPEGYPRSELTWWIIPSARRHGYALEASRAAINFGYSTLGWSLVETHMNDENTAARHLAKKLGGEIMTREKFPDGLERDVYHLPEI